MTELGEARGLVVAKAPIAGRVKTRLGSSVGMDVAARLAAASLLDTVRAVSGAFGAQRCVLALDGDLADAVEADALREALAGWTVVPQRGEGLAARLVAAHEDAGRGPLVQVGMDTPHLCVALLREVAAGLERHDAVLGAAEDGGWWVLAVREPGLAAALGTVPMSTPGTGAATLAALQAAGASVGEAPVLRDVDTAEDAAQVALVAPGTAFARAWAENAPGVSS